MLSKFYDFQSIQVENCNWYFLCNYLWNFIFENDKLKQIIYNCAGIFGISASKIWKSYTNFLTGEIAILMFSIENIKIVLKDAVKELFHENLN